MNGKQLAKVVSEMPLSDIHLCLSSDPLNPSSQASESSTLISQCFNDIKLQHWNNRVFLKVLNTHGFSREYRPTFAIL